MNKKIAVVLTAPLILTGLCAYVVSDKGIDKTDKSTTEPVEQSPAFLEEDSAPNQPIAEETAEEDNKGKEEFVEPSFISCIDSLYATDKAKYKFWKTKYKEMHPEYAHIYDAGAYCKLSDDTQLISFSYFKDSDYKMDGQAVVLFNDRDNVLR